MIKMMRTACFSKDLYATNANMHKKEKSGTRGRKEEGERREEEARKKRGRGGWDSGGDGQEGRRWSWAKGERKDEKGVARVL